MNMKVMKEKIKNILPEDAVIDDAVLEKIAGGLAQDASAEDICNALNREGFGIRNIRENVCVAKPNPDGGGLKDIGKK